MRIVLALLCSLASCLGQTVIDSYRYATSTSLLTNLVAYYKFDEASGNLVDVHAGKTFTESANTISSVAGVINTAREPAGTNRRFSRADDVDFEPGNQPFFICMWVKAASLSQSVSPTIFSKASTGQWEWELTFKDASDIVFLYLEGGGGGYIETSSPLVAGTWAFIAAGWDGTTAKISINGGAFVTVAYAGPMATGTSPIYFFTRDANTNNFLGAIDEVSFWKGRALTLTEVQGIYNSGAGKPYSAY